MGSDWSNDVSMIHCFIHIDQLLFPIKIDKIIGMKKKFLLLILKNKLSKII